MTLSRTALLALVAPAVLLVAGCSGSVSVGSPKTVDVSDVESQVTKVITGEDHTGVTVTCPDDLAAKKGATVQCDSTDDQGMLRATVTVTSVAGGDVKFDVDAVPVLAAADAATQAATQLAAQVGEEAPPDITCPDDLVGEVGTTMVCSLSDAGDTYDTTLTVTDDGGGKIGFDIDVASAPS